jgi:hypothetical protein
MGYAEFIFDYLNRYREFEIKRKIKENILSLLLNFLTFFLIFILLISIYPLPILIYFARIFLSLLIFFFIFKTYRDIKFLMNMSFENIAIIYEKKFQEINNHLINTVQIIKKSNLYPSEFIEKLKFKTFEIIKNIPPEKGIENKKIFILLKKICGVLILLLLLIYFSPQKFKKGIIRIFSNFTIGYYVEPGNCRIVKGEKIKIKFYYKEHLPSYIEIENKSIKNKFPMQNEKIYYSYLIENADSPFNYRIITSDLVTPWYRVDICAKTNIQKILLTLKYPSYTKKGIEKKEIESGSFEVLKNTEVEMDLFFNNKVGDTYLILSNGSLLTAKGTSNKKKFRFTVREPLIYRLKFYDFLTRNYISTQDEKINLIYDNSPFIEILEPGKDVFKGPGEKFKIKIYAEDDFGIKEIRFKMNILPNEIGKNDITFYTQRFPSENLKQTIETYLILPKKFEKPIYYYIECIDNSQPISNKGVSSIYYIFPFSKVMEKNLSNNYLSKKELLEDEKLKDFFQKINEKLKEFIEKENDIIKGEKKLEDVKKIKEEDLNNLIEVQSEYLKTFQKMVNDLNKMGKQTEGKFTLSDEFVEMISHIQKSIENLKKQAIHMAISESQMGLELAEEITSNLERWLAGTPDNIKWDLEEPSKDYKVPEASLPDELEDIIGELIEKEENMKEEIEDLTSSWMDSIDKGAGWGVSDGPISNMSAKGITGNLMPNQQEIGGRSREGRTGRSYGEMVEKTATGKEGRNTPARLTPDNFEPGEIQDKSRDTPLGPTGGGKISGWGPSGLTGKEGDIIFRYNALLDKQKEIIDKAEKILIELKSANIYNPELEKAISQMKVFQIQLKTGKYNELLKTKSEIISSLKEFNQSFVRKGLIKKEKVESEKTGESISKNVYQDKIPEGYENIVFKYFSLNLK